MQLSLKGGSCLRDFINKKQSEVFSFKIPFIINLKSRLLHAESYAGKLVYSALSEILS